MRYGRNPRYVHRFEKQGCARVGPGREACNQIAQLSCLEGAVEAPLIAREQGVDPARVRDAVMTGYGASRMPDLLGRKVVGRRSTPGVMAALHHKDIGVAMDLSRELALPMPVTAQVLKQLNALMAAGFGGQDSSSLLLVLERTLARSRARKGSRRGKRQ
jgi:2-hydroxy-3-oxopropionate reductase